MLLLAWRGSRAANPPKPPEDRTKADTLGTRR